jgi:hypothetical protein
MDKCMRRRSVLWLLLASLTWFRQAGLSQAVAGTISGTVRDSSGAAVPGAAVEAKNTETGVVYSATSASTGNYRVDQLPPGQYAITVTMQGMKTYAHSYLPVDKSSVIREDVVLEADDSPAYVFPYNPPPVKAATVRPPSRDFFDADAELVVTKPRVSLNGHAVELPQGLPPDLVLAVRGKIVWIYLPGHGRYLLSLAPRSGFGLAGQVGGMSLEFELRSDEIQIYAKERIAAGSAMYNLYVLHQPDWLPPDETGRSRALMGSSDRGDFK